MAPWRGKRSGQGGEWSGRWGRTSLSVGFYICSVQHSLRYSYPLLELLHIVYPYIEQRRREKSHREREREKKKTELKREGQPFFLCTYVYILHTAEGGRTSDEYSIFFSFSFLGKGVCWLVGWLGCLDQAQQTRLASIFRFCFPSFLVCLVWGGGVGGRGRTGGRRPLILERLDGMDWNGMVDASVFFCV